MATLSVSISFPSLALPFQSWPGLDRLDGATATGATFLITTGPLAGGRIVLGGSGFAYDGEELPAAGTVTSITVQRPGDFATLSVLDGFSRGAAQLRSAPDLPAVLMNGNDTLTGAGGGDRLLGGGGHDSLDGGGGHDRLEGGTGNDTLSGGAGRDQLLGGSGDDVLRPGFGRDVVRAGAGDDILRIEEDEEVEYGEILDGGSGFDTLVIAMQVFDYVGLVNAQLIGVEAIHFEKPGLVAATAEQFALIELVTLAYDPATSDGRDAVIELAREGAISLDGFDLVAAPGTQLHVNLMAGGTVYGRNESSGFAADHVSGSGERDMMWLGEGNDTALGHAGHDHLLAEEGDDVMEGGLGDDMLGGGDGADTLSGGEGNDRLEGGAGADSLSGGEGEDDLVGGSGADTLRGGLGDDDYIIHDAAALIVESGPGSGGKDSVQTYVSLTLASGVEVASAAVADLAITGNGSANLLYGASGAETLKGMAGADTLNGYGGADELWGGTGADRFVVSSNFHGGSAAGTRDRIMDFNRIQGDRIDLSGVDAVSGGGNDAFTSFGALAVGEDPAAGSLRWAVVGATTLVYAFTDAAAGADFVIEVLGMAGGAIAADVIL